MSEGTSRRPARTAGEGSIYFDAANGRWVATIELPSNGSAKRRRVKRYRKSKREAATVLRQLRREADHGADLGARMPTVAEHLDDWLTKSAPKWSPKTLADYRHHVRKHIAPALGALRLDEVRPEHVEAFYDAKVREGLSKSTLRIFGCIIVPAMRWAVARRLITWNPAAVAEKPNVTKPRKEGRALTREEAHAFLDAAEPHRLRALFVLGLTAGLRPGELIGLTWDAIDLDAGTVAVVTAMRDVEGTPVLGPTKTSDTRALHLPAPTVAILRAHRRAQAAEQLAARWPSEWDALVFRSEAGTPLDLANLRHQVRTVASVAGIGHVTTYDFRHTCATLLKEAGVGREHVSDVLGHKDARTTVTWYIHAGDTAVTAAVGPMEAFLAERPAL